MKPCGTRTFGVHVIIMLTNKTYVRETLHIKLLVLSLCCCNSFCSSGDYTIKSAAQNCRSSEYTKQLYFNGSMGLRRYLAIKNIYSTQAECDGILSQGN